MQHQPNTVLGCGQLLHIVSECCRENGSREAAFSFVSCLRHEPCVEGGRNLEEWELQDGGGATNRPSDRSCKVGEEGGNNTHLENENIVRKSVLTQF